MRFKIEIQERYETHQDSFGQPFYDWRHVCDCWASFTDDGLLVKHTDKVKSRMRAVGAGRVMMIGKTAEVMDGGNKFLKLSLTSVRGDFARARTAPKPPTLPAAHDEDDSEIGE